MEGGHTCPPAPRQPMANSEFRNPNDDIDKHGQKLPHWQQGEAMQFVTFRLGDSIPKAKVDFWLAERKMFVVRQPPPWDEATARDYQERFTRKLENWLDDCVGSCLLREPANREILAATMMRFHGERYDFHSWVIMPNHVHTLFTPKEKIEKSVQAWKGVSARVIGKGSIWQRDYRDTLIRDADHFRNAVRYIRRNPSKAKLREGEYSLWESPRAAAVGLT